MHIVCFFVPILFCPIFLPYYCDYRLSFVVNRSHSNLFVYTNHCKPTTVASGSWIQVFLTGKTKSLTFIRASSEWLPGISLSEKTVLQNVWLLHSLGHTQELACLSFCRNPHRIIMDKDYEEELNSLVAQSLSETSTPLQGGGSLISDLTSSNINATNLNSVFTAVDNVDSSSKLNVGKLLGNVTKRIIEEDNRLYTIKLVKNLCNGDLSSLCKQKRAGGKNTFCTSINCLVNHHNDSSPPIQLSLNSIIIMRSKNVAFISPIGSIENVDHLVLSEWLDQQATLSEWADRFFLSELSDGKASSKEHLQDLKDFSDKAATHKTPFKVPNMKYNLKSFTPHNKETFLKGIKNLKDGGFGMTSLEYFGRVDDYLAHIEEVINNMLSNINITNDDIFTTLKMLELEKNRLKRELGNRNQVSLSDNFDALSVWESVSLIGDAINDLQASNSDDINKPNIDTISFRTFENYARKMIQDHQVKLKSSISKDEMEKEINSLRKENRDLKNNFREVNQRLQNLELSMKSFDHLHRDMENRVDILETNNTNSSYNSNYHSHLETKFNMLSTEIENLRPNDNPRKVKFLELSVQGLGDMMKWLESHVPSMNYSLIADVHIILEHVHHQINPSKSTLDFLQAIFKLEIPTPNHAVTIQSFDSALPKFFCKSKDHKVIRGTDSLFDNIKSYADWDLPNYGFRERLTDEIGNAEIAIENAIREDASLSAIGRSLLRNALSSSVQALDLIIRYIDQTYRELIRSKYTVEKAWHLVTMLVTRIFTDIFEPRLGKLNIMETKNPSQVATVVYHSCFKSLEEMKIYKEHGIAKHPNIASEYVKFIAHNTPYQLVETLEKKVSKVDDKLVDHINKIQPNIKQLNSLTQKVEKISNLESRIAKLEKK